MADQHSSHVPIDLHSAAGDEDAVKGEPTSVRAGDAEAIGLRRLPIEQAKNWTSAVSGAQRQGLAGFERDLKLFRVDSALGDFDDGALGRIGEPFREGVVYAREVTCYWGSRDKSRGRKLDA